MKRRRLRAGPLSAGSCGRCTKRDQEELPHVRGQGQQPRVPGCDGAGTAERSYPRSGEAAERSYPASEARDGGRKELPRVQGQGVAPKARGGGWEEKPHI